MYNQKIAVIGAGAAGLTAAHQLKSKGYENVTVFEKESDVGGKVSTYMHKGKPYEIGAVWAVSDYKTIDRLTAEFNVPRYTAKGMSMMMSNGRPVNLLEFIFIKHNFFQLSRDVFHFWRFCATHSQIYQPGFLDLHSDFYLPLEQLSEKYGFPMTSRAMAPTMSACGYGFYQEVPAMYWMKLMVMLFNYGLRGADTFNNLKSYTNGYQSLWRAVAKDLDVRLSTPVTSLKRTGEGQQNVEITAAGTTQSFNKVIIAAPLENADKFMDVSDTEKTLFKKIRTIRYIITVASVNRKHHIAFVKNINPGRLGHVNAALQFHADTDVCVYFQMVEDTTTTKEALKILTEDLKEIGSDLKEVIHQKVWNYFPHVLAKDLEDGFYYKMDSLQGKNNSYFAGSLLSFESVEHTAAYARALVNRFF